jgi:hypothetical protein
MDGINSTLPLQVAGKARSLLQTRRIFARKSLDHEQAAFEAKRKQKTEKKEKTHWSSLAHQERCVYP